DDVFAQAMEGRLAGGARIGHGGNTALQAGLVCADRNVRSAVPDMHVEIGPAGREPRAAAVDDLGIVDRPVGNAAFIVHGDFGESGFLLEADRAEVPEKKSHAQSSLEMRGSSASRRPSPTICSAST